MHTFAHKNNRCNFVRSGIPSKYATLVALTVERVGVEGMAQRKELVQNAAQGPDVRLVVVWFVFEQFWRHVVGCPDAGFGIVQGAVQHF